MPVSNAAGPAEDDAGVAQAYAAERARGVFHGRVSRALRADFFQIQGLLYHIHTHKALASRIDARHPPLHSSFYRQFSTRSSKELPKSLPLHASISFTQIFCT